MINRRIAATLSLAIPIVGALYACSDSLSESAYGDPNNPPNAKTDAGGFNTGEKGVGQASGVVLVHAAAFPSFRVCFENRPELAPQPDDTVMPEANVVGVEVGSVARIAPVATPGTVYIIEESVIRSKKKASTRKCGELICKPGVFETTCLRRDSDYQAAGSIADSLGQDRVHLLFLTGCGGKTFLDRIGIDPKDCGTWDSTLGSLKARTLPLLPSTGNGGSELPVQLIHLSTPLEGKRGNDALEISFNSFVDAGPDGGGRQVLETNPLLFEAGQVKNLLFDHEAESTYGTRGFQVAIHADGGADAGPKTSILLNQSLAEVQELSSPGEVPTTYYRAASNYALLLLGDPRIPRYLQDGGQDPTYDQRRGLHLLAIPVKEPKDGGTDAGGTDLPLPEGDASSGSK